MSHTPGPWRAGADEPFVYALNDAGTNRFFAGVQSGFLTQGGTNKPTDVRTPFDEVMANARLIAAAPDLLVAAKEVLFHEKDMIVNEFWDALDKLEAAIAKAEGK